MKALRNLRILCRSHFRIEKREQNDAEVKIRFNAWTDVSDWISSNDDHLIRYEGSNGERASTKHWDQNCLTQCKQPSSQNNFTYLTNLICIHDNI